MRSYCHCHCTAHIRAAAAPRHQFLHTSIISSSSSSSSSCIRHYDLWWNSTCSTRRIRINFQDDLYTDDDNDFPFTKHRVWWSDDNNNNYDDDEDADDDQFSIFKVFRAFGWMVPAIAISFLLGTGPNAFFMALAVPLGQTALSLVIDKVWGSTTRRSKPRPRTRTRTSRTRKKPFVRPTSREETSNSKENTSRKEEGSYESWMAADGSSRKKSSKRVHPFGGWDELDELHKVPRGTEDKKADELPKQQRKSKLSRARRVKDTPLFLRLLIAVFPFLGSWSRFLF
ncbi:hypothetical protein M5689_024459 [Euphorbia peplus]|nr:hypothetical protein M5689_024459 [Euphorbia peplus]